MTQQKIQRISLASSLVCFFLSNFLWIYFDRTYVSYQFISRQYFCEVSSGESAIYGYDNIFLSFVNKFIVSFGVDGISLFFVLLSTFIVPLCLLTS